MNGMVIVKTIRIMYLKKMYYKTTVFKNSFKKTKFNDYFPYKNDLHNKREIPEVMQTYS